MSDENARIKSLAAYFQRQAAASEFMEDAAYSLMQIDPNRDYKRSKCAACPHLIFRRGDGMLCPTCLARVAEALEEISPTPKEKEN